MLSLTLLIAVPVMLYILFCFPWVQERATSIAEKELTNLLGSRVEIGIVDLAPFNRVVLRDVDVRDMRGEPLLKAKHLGAGVSLWQSMMKRQIVVTYAELIETRVNLYRDSIGAPLNLDPILARLKGKPKKEKSKLELAINMIVLRQSGFAYNVLSEPRAKEGVFNANHVIVSDIRADLRVPHISGDEILVDLKRFAALEQSGLAVEDFAASVKLGKTATELKGVRLKLTDSEVRLADIILPSVTNGTLKAEQINTTIGILDGSHIAASDVAPLVPALRGVKLTAEVSGQLSGGVNDLKINNLCVKLPEAQTSVCVTGALSNILNKNEELSYCLKNIKIESAVSAVRDKMAEVTVLSKAANAIPSFVDRLGRIMVEGSVEGGLREIEGELALKTECGVLDVEGSVAKKSVATPLKVKGNLSTESFNPSKLFDFLGPLSSVKLTAEADLQINKGDVSGRGDVRMPRAVWEGKEFTGLSASAELEDSRVEVEVASTTPWLDFTAMGCTDLKSDSPHSVVYANCRRIVVGNLLKGEKYKDFEFSTVLEAAVTGKKIDDVAGWITLDDLQMNDGSGKSVTLKEVMVEAEHSDDERSLKLRGGPVNMSIEGQYTYKSLLTSVVSAISRTFPTLAGLNSEKEERMNEELATPVDARLNLYVDVDTTITQFFKLPFDIVHPVTLRASSNSTYKSVNLQLDAPYIRQGNKLIEGTQMRIHVNGNHGNCSLLINSKYPGKSGNLDLQLLAAGTLDSINTQVKWNSSEDSSYKGMVAVGARFNRDEQNRLLADISVMPTTATVNDSVWTVCPGKIKVDPGLVTLTNVGAERARQHVRLNGSVGADSLSRLVVSLKNFDVDYLFETLNLGEAVMFGGRATGNFYGDALLSKQPRIYTPLLKVKGIKYNHAVMGNADIRSAWDPEKQGITIDADVAQENNDTLRIKGMIRPIAQELDFHFDAHRSPVNFLQPFFRSFTSSITGEATGRVHLFGTFSNINLEGDAVADNFKMHVDFLNVDYTVPHDTVFIRPGIIRFRDVTVTDPQGNRAKFNGEMTHYFFREAKFRFDITDARNMLVYNVSEAESLDPWYGKIYGDGSVTISGVPQRTDISVNMSTAPHSSFVFRTVTTENSGTYDFVTLRERKEETASKLSLKSSTPLAVRRLREKLKQQAASPSVLGVELNLDVNQNANLMLLMNETGSDRLVGEGRGHVRLNYASDGDVQMFGDYTVSRGTYTFTLTDLIIKDFEIRNGSKVKFLGNPEAAQLDILAVRAVNANIADLDESFTKDPELNRTNVRVNAKLLLRGDMRQPNVGFDMEFPTLSTELDRKVKSLLSTDELMGRQVMCLVAFNRFNTPEYMAATKNNELVMMASSVLSSTISSYLGSMLGQFNDHISLAPSIRSDRGDFSDMEVDMGLNTQWLDNRLRFNGNVGYRDKTMNKSAIIGDFDVSWNFGRTDMWTLNVYNRFNDQNFYQRNALTTQGFGVGWRKDFNNPFSRFWQTVKSKKKEIEEKREPADSAAVNR